MCLQVVVGGAFYGNLDGLLAAGLIGPEHVPTDPELAELGLNVTEVCFCNVDVEEVLADAGVHFRVELDGDLIVEEAS